MAGASQTGGTNMPDPQVGSAQPNVGGGIPATLERLRVPLDGLHPYEANPRRGNVDVIVESLRAHGQYRPIVVRAKTFEILAGNHTYAAAKQLGWTEIAATFIECSDDEAARIVLVDNRSADLGTYDDAVLLSLLSSIPTLDGTGFDQDDLAFLQVLQASQDVTDLQDALDAADESAWPWVKAQLDPENFEQFIHLPGDDHLQKLLHLLHRVV